MTNSLHTFLHLLKTNKTCMTSNTTNVVTISKTCIAGVENGQDIQYHNIKATTELKWQMSGNSTSK